MKRNLIPKPKPSLEYLDKKKLLLLVKSKTNKQALTATHDEPRKSRNIKNKSSNHLLNRPFFGKITLRV